MQKWDGSYEKLCEQLDSLLVQYFALYDNLVEQRSALTDHLKTGHFQLSKAKYSMGPQKISPLSYHMGMKARKILRVNCSCETEKPENVGHCCCFSEDISADTDEDGDDDRDNGPYLRRNISKDGDTTITKQRKTIRTEKDPLKWFGVLVSLQLKLAQRSFINTITQSIEIANIQHKMNAIEVEYNRLKEIKRSLKGDSSSSSSTASDDSTDIEKVTIELKSL
eukprot:TRINITY_DN2608_c0_g3_i2.p1 TRINITY_DN2608_c0_g3~~TRINITY_DN2608_c0_g3_i2.p1  ORF type:complete len:223 (-),score=38.55 TRINITY_DN2608_c0_g3_i2:202-870(-)